MKRNTPMAVPSTLPMVPLRRITTMDWATEKNTSGTTSTKIKFRKSVPTGLKTAAFCPSATPSTAPAASPARSHRVEE